MGLKDRIRRLEKEAEGEMVLVPQKDGTVRRFPQSALQESFMTNMRRLKGEDVPHHPLGVAAAESPDPEWSRSFYSAAWTDIVAPVEDLSE
ncbi:MAG: hypothetical protein AVDCRST_MAG02-3450 [uncultured Rubrobacteraceae bacterium]|uniref:Uncharacterized protein n=1 Tax=uncultured Rubrobacteraceae bacterium TaxID=349277 RepID=A0A6J4RAG6_9ACTN|nr:MAG: hypothetical protein AVDCRST_MAG02-3450 [uncultured Rubrobacteraceae bacterium]